MHGLTVNTAAGSTVRSCNRALRTDYRAY